MSIFIVWSNWDCATVDEVADKTAMEHRLATIQAENAQYGFRLLAIIEGERIANSPFARWTPPPLVEVPPLSDDTRKAFDEARQRNVSQPIEVEFVES